MLTADDFREIALSLHDAIERAHMGHPDFRANGRVFASLHANEESGTMKLTPEEQAEFMRAHQKMFTPAAGRMGPSGMDGCAVGSRRRSGATRCAVAGVAERHEQASWPFIVSTEQSQESANKTPALIADECRSRLTPSTLRAYQRS